MVMNRRAMLLGSLATVALTLSGCKKKTKTKVVFVNNTNQPVSVNATAGGQKFKKNNIAPGNKKSDTYKTSNNVGDQVPVKGTLAFKTVPGAINIPAVNVTAGRTNTITVTGTITNGVFTAGPNFGLVVS